MNTTTFPASLTLIPCVATLILLSSSGLAQAEPLQPATPPAASASPVHVHAHAEHPAVQVARLAATRGVDSNTFIVQPPASVTWLLGPAMEPDVRMAAGMALTEQR